MKKYLIVLFAAVLFSCGNQEQPSESIPSPMMKVKMTGESSASPVLITERKLIKNGTLNFEVEDIVQAKSEVTKISTAVNAYVSSEDQTNFDDRVQYNQIIRVPASHFEELVTKIEALAIKIENKNINSQDVTEEFIDIEARLKTKKDLENRYREILKQAKTVAEIISIESQIANVRGEIESMEGRLNFLKSQVSLSTLTLTYYEKVGTNFGFVSKFSQSLSSGWDNLLSFLVGLASVWPFLIILGSGIWWLIRREKLRRQKISL
jgi:hypothetical protein